MKLFPFLALALCAQAATVNTTVTINGSGTSTGGNISATGTVTLSGIGTGTLSSTFSLLTAALTGSAPLTITITSGSPTGTLTASLSGSPTLLAQVFAGTPGSNGPATLTVTAGTGGFAGTTGTLNTTAAGTGVGTTGSGAGSFSITGSGSLNIPNFTGGGGGAGAPTLSGILNNYSYTLPGLPNYGIAPGALFIVTGSNLATNSTPVLQSSASPGIPTSLNGTSLSVTVNGVTTTPGLYYTSNGQLAAVLPSSTPVGTGTLTVTTASGTSQTSIQVVQSALGFDAYYGTGTGLAVATDANGVLFQNSRSVSPGQTIVLWGSGVGADTSNTDKVFPLNQNNLTGIPMQVFIGGIQATIAYKGRSQFPGVDQVVVTIPTNVAPGCSVSVVAISGNVTSNTVTLPIAANNGTCSDPTSPVTPSQIQTLSSKSTIKFGTLTVLQSTTRAAGITTTSNAAGANFFSLPGSNYLVSANGATAPSIGSCILNTAIGSGGGSLPTGLDAGTITLTGGGTSATLQSTPIVPGTYFAQLSSIPATGATYNFNGQGGRDVGGFAASLAFPIPLVWTNQGITAVGRAQGVTVNWTGGAAGTFVSITGGSSATTSAGTVTVTFTCYANVSAQQFTVPSAVLLSLPASSNGTLSLSNSTNPGTFTASGLDLGFTTASSITGITVAYQ